MEYPLIRDSICNSTGSHKFKCFINDIYMYNINSDLFGNGYFFITILKCSTFGLQKNRSNKKFIRLNYLILSVISITADTQTHPKKAIEKYVRSVCVKSSNNNGKNKSNERATYKV